MNKDKVQELLAHFQKYPSMATTSFSRLETKFKATREEIQEAKVLFKTQHTGVEETVASDKVIDLHHNYEEGSIKAKITSDTQIRTPEELFVELDLNLKEWKCTQFWSIYKNGKWNISAFIKKIQVYNPIEEYNNYLNSETDWVPLEILRKESDSVLLVYLSDRHIGAATKTTSMLENEYNAEVYRSRMSQVLSEVLKLHEANTFKTIIVIDLGDTVDGMNGKTTRGEHLLPQNMTNREVYNTFMDVELEFMEVIRNQTQAEVIRYTIGDSNHGGDFEWMCHKSLEYALRKETDIQIYTGEKFIEHFFVGDHCFMICHGKDSEDMRYPLPKTLNDKTENWIKSYMDAHSINSKYVHFIKGDLHSLTCEYGRFFRYKNVPSLYGSSKWVHTNFMQNTRAVSFEIITNNTLTEHTLFF